MIPKTSSRRRYHLDAGAVESETSWEARPGLCIRELFSDRDGYRISLVRYAEGGFDPERMHSGDEHVFVLGGGLRDANGDYGPGTYLLNPAGLRPRIWSPGGCLAIIHRLPPDAPGSIPVNSGGLEEIFEDEESRALNGGGSDSRTRMRSAAGRDFRVGAGWGELRPGVFMLPMFEGAPGNYKSALLRYLPGSSIPEHIHMGDEHVYMLEGSQEDETGSYDEGSYVYNPTGTGHRVWSEEGCLALIHWRAPVRYLQDLGRWS
jgi:anti-sigma factor ChrR (cupin superfamily)